MRRSEVTMRRLRTITLIALSSFALLAAGAAAPSAQADAQLLRAGGSSVDASLAAGGSGCQQRSLYVVGADAGSTLLDPGIGSDQIYLVYQAYDQCTFQWSSYFYRVGDLETGALQISADRQTATLRSSFETTDYADGSVVHVYVSLEWTNTGERTLQADQRHRVHDHGLRMLQRLSYDNWSAGVRGSISVDGNVVLSSADAEQTTANIGSDQTSQLLIQKLAALAAATESSGSSANGTVQPSDRTLERHYAYAHWSGGDGACLHSQAEVTGGIDGQGAGLIVTVGRWDACTGQYFEWISSFVPITLDQLSFERGGSAATLEASAQLFSSVTMQPVTISLRVHWDGDPTTWDTFSSHQLDPNYRIHYTNTIRPATPTAEITIDRSPVELGQLDQASIVDERFWTNLEPQH
jgi:hypothetical protein